LCRNKAEKCQESNSKKHLHVDVFCLAPGVGLL
jgi:hypothetical protein